MKEFAFGTAAQFAALKQELSQGKFYKFANRQLPMCIPPTATIWFAKQNDVYVMYIDKGITTTSDNQNFRHLLEHGEVKFICIDDMVDFLHSLQSLFSEEDTNNASVNYENDINNIPPTAEGLSNHTINTTEQQEQAAVDPITLVDMEGLKKLREEEKKVRMVWPEEIAKPLKEKVFGQDEVLDKISEKIVINRMRKDKKLLVMALIGPTATGKSETAKSLATVLSDVYDTKFGVIEIAGSEFIGEHTVHRFFGAPPGYVGHGQPTVLDPVRKNPNHIIVIDEIEKADVKLLTGLMEAIDTGYLGMADNSKPIDLNQCILMFTSNIPIDMEEYKDLSDFGKSEMCRDLFTKHCGRPEISGKIGNFVVFSPLDDVARTRIVIKFVKEELHSYDVRLIHIDKSLMNDFLKHETKYGARGIRDLVSDSIGGRLLRDHKLETIRGKDVSMKGTIDNIDFEVA